MINNSSLFHGALRIELVLMHVKYLENSFSHSISVHFYYLIIQKGARVQSWLENNTFDEWEPIKSRVKDFKQCFEVM